MKRLIKIISILLTVSFLFAACFSKTKVSEQDYEAAFTAEMLSNVTMSMGNDNAKEHYYRIGESFLYYRTKEDIPYYGEFYTIKDTQELYYIYGSESPDNFTEEQAVWRKAEFMLEKDSYFHNAEFIRLYRRDFHLLEYDRKTKSYKFDFVAQGYDMTYAYFFEDKKLVKIEITETTHKYDMTWLLYDYGTTEFPNWVIL